MKDEAAVIVHGAPVLYAELVASLLKSPDEIRISLNNERMNLLHGAVGVAEEAGEVLGVIKKHVLHSKPLDRTAVIKELGDLRFYMQVLQNQLGISEDEILQMNADKLSTRYKGGYSDAASIARVDMETKAA